VAVATIEKVDRKRTLEAVAGLNRLPEQQLALSVAGWLSGAVARPLRAARCRCSMCALH
jgi:hypothetical protein